MMRENVLTKKPNVSVMRQMDVIPFYEDKLDIEMMEVLRTMQSPVVDERRRVQQRVINKHRLDSERQYWLERDVRDNENRVLRKTMSLNDIRNFSGRNPRSYLEIHQQQIDAARSDSVTNSRANSSQDTYQYRPYPRGEVNSSALSMVYHGSQPSSRLSMANVPMDNTRRETPNRYDSSQFARSESNNSYPVNTVRRYSSQGPVYDDAFRGPNISRANNVSRPEVNDARRMAMPYPNIKHRQGSEEILVTMSPGRPDRVSIRMAPVPSIPLSSSKSSAPPSNQSSNKVQYNSSGANGQSGTNSSRQEGTSSLKPSSSNSNSRSISTVKMDKSQHNTPSIVKSAKRNNAKSDIVEKTEKPASSQKRVIQTERSASSTRSNQPEWYSRIDADSTANSKDAEKEKKGNPTTASMVKTHTKVITQNKTPARVQNITNKQDKTKGIRKTTKQNKPQQSSLRKTNSFKVVGRSTNFFGFVSMADIKAKKKVTFSNDDSERPGTA
ncbi:hypothetical protein KP79_PYT10580 [Mizuhopecten yessoensis]|uniref:Uncharacterized protein n=1 Tax=Mizuhopecten yessoensis TaxID=6573 RepID=A0A210PGX7_MIZYE|nr:hypothetical protein KP79_PYT10580 [Mizuhopecten yessoensis]